MKVILLTDIYKKGVAGDVVDVAPGFARNYLIPRGMAVKATPGAMRRLENLRKHSEVRRAERGQEFGKIAEQIEGLTLYFGVRAGETGKLYGSVTPAEIAEQLHELVGLEIDRRRIGDRPLRELGTFEVPVRLDANLTPHVKVIIFREGEDPRLAGAAAETAAETVEVETLEVEASVEEIAPGAEAAESAAAEEA